MAGPRLAIFAAVLCAVALAAHGAHGGRIARIVGGKSVDIKAAPWLVQLVLMNRQDPSKILGTPCAGAIVDDRHILTAAHCFDDDYAYAANDPQTYLQVLVGSTERFWGGKTGGKFYKIKSAAVNSQYNVLVNGEPETNNYLDVAVLETQERIKFSSTVKAIPIAKSRPRAGTPLVAGGWGVNTVDRSKTVKDYHPGLHVANMNVMTDLDCLDHVDELGVNDATRYAIMCARNVDGNTCQGDSGSGVWTQGKEGPQLVGLVQSGATCHVESDGLYVDLNNDEVRAFLGKHGVKA